MDLREEIAYYNALPVVFEGFLDLPQLTDGVVSLECTAKKPAIPEKNWVPSYSFDICGGGVRIGAANLRVGYTEGLYYGGHIGYGIDEAHRGNSCAARACRLLAGVARAHGMAKLLITNERSNAASMRVCEKLGARLLRTAPVPEWHDRFMKGDRFVNIYEFKP